MTIEATVHGAAAELPVGGVAQGQAPLIGRRRGTRTGPFRGVIVGGRRGERRLDASRSRPTALLEARDRAVLDWIEEALRTNGAGDLTYVGGYQIQKVMDRFPGLNYRFHARWQEEGEVAALCLGLAGETGDHLIVRGDTVLRIEAVERLLDSPGAIVAGSRLTTAGATAFAGAFLVRAAQLPRVLAAARLLAETDASASLEALLDRLADVERVELTNLAAPIGEPGALLGTVFRGKARTLAGVAALCRSATVLDQVRFGATDWAADPAVVLATIRTAFRAGIVVVRSSTTTEDGTHASAAGRFDSVLDVATDDEAGLAGAITRVVASYASRGRAAHPGDEVLVQPQVRNLTASGVLFTRDLATGAPYFVLSIDRRSGRSDLVTSGADGDIDTHYISWSAPEQESEVDLGRIVGLGRELMALTYLDSLDVEFGLDRDGSLYLFQVRPLAARPGQDQVFADDDQHSIVTGAHEFVTERMAVRPGVPGRRSILGNMPDWNPAEMLGAAPRPLALSLYQRLVGDRVWARARARIGYRDLEPEPLILAVGGRPYVDVRASLASFLPAGLAEATADRWIDACLDRIAAEPHLHDKIEFEVTPTCLAFDWPRHAERMRAAGLPAGAIELFREGLRSLTAAMIGGGEEAVGRELEAGERLTSLRAQSLLPSGSQGTASRMGRTAPALARAVRDHLERCERHGVEPFAVLARQAFVAMAMLRSLGDRGVLTDAQIATILRSIPTVAGETARAIHACSRGALTRDAFIAEYGHLRSNSYEITAPNYVASLDWLLGGASGGPAEGVVASSGVEAQVDGGSEAGAIVANAAPDIERLLQEAGLPGDATTLFAFIRAAIAGRERAKFEFMKDLNLVIETIAAFGSQVGLTRDDLSHLHLSEILVHATDSLSGATAARLRRSAGQNRKAAAVTAALRLPDLIRSPSEVLAFRQEAWRPNFVTTRRVVARTVALVDGGAQPGDRAGGRGARDGTPGPSLDGAIVLIRAADPGYDWLFSHRIAGLVTQYGGIGSHMAIRAAEFGLPAAIGCGEALFETLRGAAFIDLDCANQRVRPSAGAAA